MKDEITKYAGRDQTLTANAARVSAIVQMAADDMALATKGEKVPLTDLQRVKETAEAYLRECSESGTMPTVRGCAARLGITRNACYDRAKKHPGSEFARWLSDFSDLCGETMMQAALEGTVAAVPAIFTAKSRYGWREAPAQLEIGQLNPLTDTDRDPAELAAEIAAKYADLPDD